MVRVRNSTKRRLISNGTPLFVKEVKLPHMKHYVFLVTMNKHGLKVENNTIYMNTAVINKVNNYNDDDNCASIIVILRLFMSDNQKLKTKRQWGRGNYDEISRSKPNIIKGNSQTYGYKRY